MLAKPTPPNINLGSDRFSMFNKERDIPKNRPATAKSDGDYRHEADRQRLMTSDHKADGTDSEPRSRVPDTRHHDVASDGGAEHWAVIASLIETCKLTDVDPHAYLVATITKIVNGHSNSRLDVLLPWTYPAATALKHVA